MLKRFAMAGAVALALTAAVAYGQGATKTYTDAQNRFTFQYPSNMGNPDVTSRPNQPVNIVVGLGAFECQMFAVDNAQSASQPPDAVVRAYGTAITTDLWKRQADAFALYNRQGTVDSSTVDTSGFWPVQRAMMKSDDGTAVTAALQARPGLELWQFCTSFDGADHTPVFNQIINSFAGSNDAALQAAAEAAIAEHNAKKQAAEAAAEAAKNQPPAQQKKKYEGRRGAGEH